MKVSVLMLAYNQEQYIAQAIESALAQEVDFEYELVIGEDSSTDGTRDIVVGFQQRYPDRIKTILPATNVGMQQNLVQTLRACRGRYIALLEGDDYWTSAHKLQKQADFLDSHPEYAGCFHNVTVVHEDGSHAARLFSPASQKATSTLEDLLAENFIPTCSMMFRGGLFGDIPDWFRKLKMGDWPLHILNAQHGKIGYIAEVMGVYRIHSGGAWSSQSLATSLTAMIEMYEQVNTHLAYEYDAQIKTIIDRLYFELAVAHRDAGNIGKAKEYARIGIRARRANHQPGVGALYRFMAGLYIRGLNRHTSQEVKSRKDIHF